MDNGEMYYRRFLSGDKDGLAEIVRMYREGLTMYINNIVHNIDVAEELMEDTFVKLYVSKPKYNGKSSFKTWLYSIGRYTAIDYIRHNSKISAASYEELQTISEDEELERDYIKKEEKIILHRAIKRLRADYSHVLYLVFFEEFSVTETAQIMKKSKKQVSDLLYNAKKALKAELEKEGFRYEEL